jgi:hypothetical protein
MSRASFVDCGVRRSSLTQSKRREAKCLLIKTFKCDIKIEPVGCSANF